MFYCCLLFKRIPMISIPMNMRWFSSPFFWSESPRAAVPALAPHHGPGLPGPWLWPALFGSALTWRNCRSGRGRNPARRWTASVDHWQYLHRNQKKIHGNWCCSVLFQADQYRHKGELDTSPDGNLMYIRVSVPNSPSVSIPDALVLSRILSATKLPDFPEYGEKQTVVLSDCPWTSGTKSTSWSWC